jgi:hypothetical protein
VGSIKHRWPRKHEFATHRYAGALAIVLFAYAIAVYGFLQHSLKDELVSSNANPELAQDIQHELLLRPVPLPNNANRVLEFAFLAWSCLLFKR